MGAGNWITAGVAGLVALFGLLAASRAADEAFYYGGWIVAILGIGYIFLAIRRHYDRVDAEQARRHQSEAAHR